MYPVDLNYIPDDDYKPSKIGKIPPQAVDIEMAVLGAILIDKEASLKVMQTLSPDIFYKDAHSKIFSAMVSLFEKGEAIDIITLQNELKRRGHLESIGGVFYLTDLTSKVTSGANIEYHSKILIEKYILRQIITECSSIIEKSFSEKNDAFQLLDEVESQIFKLYEKRTQKSYTDIKSAIHRTIEQLESYHGLGGKMTGIPTGFADLDSLTGGFQKSDFIVLAGRPGQGKTAFALNIMRNAAVDYEVPVAFFSLEMSTMQLVQRLLCAEASVNLQEMRNGKLSERKWQLLSMRVGRLAAAQIYIDDTPAISLLELRAKARRLKLEKDIGLIMVDYLQLMRGPQNAESREREISVISGGLKALAKELDIPIVALSQLNRQVESRADKRPQLSDLRESGSIEQDADMVIFVHRPETYGNPKDDEEIKNLAEIIIGKQRSGPTGEFKLTFMKEYTRFERRIFIQPQELPPPMPDFEVTADEEPPF